jgi:hypothetical protein
VLWHKPQALDDLLTERGILVTRASDEAVAGAQKLGIQVVNADQQVLVAVRPPKTNRLQGRDVMILVSYCHLFAQQSMLTVTIDSQQNISRDHGACQRPDFSPPMYWGRQYRACVS